MRNVNLEFPFHVWDELLTTIRILSAYHLFVKTPKQEFSTLRATLERQIFSIDVVGLNPRRHNPNRWLLVHGVWLFDPGGKTCRDGSIEDGDVVMSKGV